MAPRRGKNGARTPVTGAALRPPPRGKRQTGPRGRNRGGKKKDGGGGSLRTLHTRVFDAAHGMHLPLPVMVTPYAVQRFIRNTSIVADPVHTTYVALFPGGFLSLHVGEVFSGNSDNYTDLVGITGLGPQFVSSSAKILSQDITNIANGGGFGHAEMAVSAMSVDVCCNSSALASSGQVWMGRLNAPIEFWANQSQSWDTAFGGFVGRQGVVPMTYHQLYTTHKVLATPMDYVTYESFMPLCADLNIGSAAGGGRTSVNGMTPILLVFSPGGATYNLRIATEARVRYPVSSALYTLHARHTPTPHDTYHKILGEAENILGGVIRSGENAAESIIERRLGIPRAGGLR